MYIDSHAHLEGRRYEGDRDEVIHRAREGGVDVILTVGQVDADFSGMNAALELANSYPFVVTSVGLHPHDARHFSAEKGKQMLELAKHPKIVAWGECGLDFYYDHSPRDRQREAFREQLRLAREARLPVIVHSRDAAEETLAIVGEEWAGSGLGGVFHCFGYDYSVAHEALNHGFYISFSGIVTFKTAIAVKETAVDVPLERIVIETDCPFLAPIPHRGKRNEPLFVREVAAEIARLRGLAAEAVAAATTENFRRLFAARLGAALGGEAQARE
jgi:TatD DNase family protein